MAKPSSTTDFRECLPGFKAAFSVAFVAVLAQALLLIFRQPGNLLQAGLMGLTVLSTAFLGGENGRFDLRQPWCALMIFHIPFWVIGSIHTVLDPLQQASWLSGASHHIGKALFIVSVGFFVISIGYRFGVVLQLPVPSILRSSKEWNLSRLAFAILVCFCITWFARWKWYSNYLHLPFVEVLEIGPPPTWIRTFAYTVPHFLIVATWAAYYHTGRRNLLILGWLLTASDICWGILYGVMKTLMFLPIFLPILPHIIQRGRIPWTRIVSGAAFLLLLIYPYVDAIRNEYFIIGGPPRSEAIRIALSSGPVFSLEPEQMFHFANKTLDRVTGIGSISQILQLEENGDMDINGAFYIRSILGLIPRVFWPNKPVIAEGVYFSAYLDGAKGLDSIDPKTVYGAVSPTLFGSFYWNLGWVGLIVTAFALGVFSGISYRLFKKAGLSKPSVFLFYAAVLAILDTTESEFVKLPSSFVWGVSLVWAANLFLSHTSKNPDSAPREFPGNRKNYV